MGNTLPSQNLTLLKSLLGKEIVKVKRQLFDNDLDLEDYEQNADGPIEITTNDGLVMHFIADTERCSIGVVPGEMPRYGDSYSQRDVSTNSFWGDRIGKKISQVILCQHSDFSEYIPSEYGVEISLINGQLARFEYINEIDNPDTIRVTDQHIGQHCRTIIADLS